MRRADPTSVARLHALVGAADAPGEVERAGTGWAAPADAPTLRLVPVRPAPITDIGSAPVPDPGTASVTPLPPVPTEVGAEVAVPAPALDGAAAPSLVWAPPGGLGDALAAAVRARVPAPLRSGRWDPGRRGAYLVAVLGIVAALVATAFAMHGRARPAASGPPPLPAVTAAVTAAGTADGLATGADDPLAGPTMQVDVEGRVRHPGLVTLPAGARVAQALRAAGGALAGTDTSALDLAQKVTDGQQLRVGLPPTAAGTSTGGSAPGGVPDAAGAALIDLNTATADQLDALPHVGPATAAKIISWRTAHGPFSAVTQLQQVSGIGPSTYQDIAPLVTV